MALEPLFGLNVDPNTDQLDETIRRAEYADKNGIDLITIQDHPYQRRFVDTMTLLSYLAAKTENVRLGTNVANLPLRPPAMLAKQVATLDVLSNGRMELGLGAGAFWQAIEAWGVPARSPKEAYTAFEDAMVILRGMWANAGRSFSYNGEFYQVKGAQPGPAPRHPIRIWVGASGPKMLKLTGRMADGVLVSSTYEPPERLLEINQRIDEGAAEAGRPTDAIRRGYNLMGIIDVGQGKLTNVQDGVIYGTVKEWVEKLTRFYIDYRQDTFLLWPVASPVEPQLDAFTKEIIPAVREAVAGSRV
jgi:alkanesulfonate monooxygenase SsuD/methylene tetrahydromethanopterin reductase-like flavin-dependent oxidoreductase (luciferase family)